jgi:aspartate/methionine/tyrosine aminotransferase
MDNSHFTWAAQPSGRKPVVEMITAPNNPDGVVHGPLYPGSMPVYDRAYWWPHFTPVSPVEDDIMLFTLSKLTGHGGTRIGWALVKDADVAAKMADYVHATGRISHDAMLRGATVLNHVVESSGGPLWWAMEKMNGRWDTLVDILCTDSNTDGSACVPRNARFVLENTRPRTLEMDAFTGTERRPNDPYVWLRCANPADVSTGCTNVMSAAGMDFSSGVSFGADPGTHIRLELLMTEDTFDVVAHRLRTLVQGG